MADTTELRRLRSRDGEVAGVGEDAPAGRVPDSVDGRWPDFRVIRVRRPATIRNIQIRGLLELAIAKTNYPGTSPDLLYEEIANNITSNHLGVFIGLDAGTPVAVAVAMLPASRAMMAPQAFLVYNGGRKELARMVGKRLKDWIKGAGYTRMLAINLYRDERVFRRGFGHFGPSRVLGQLIEFGVE